MEINRETHENHEENNSEVKHKRRPRYSGLYPKKFSEKYKELNPEKYGDTIEHIIEKGGTPAAIQDSRSAAAQARILFSKFAAPSKEKPSNQNDSKALAEQRRAEFRARASRRCGCALPSG